MNKPVPYLNPENLKGPYYLNLRSGQQAIRMTLGGGENAQRDFVHLVAAISTLPDGLTMDRLTETAAELAHKHGLIEVEKRTAPQTLHQRRS